MKKILILGSNSFSGSHIVNFLIKKKFKIYGISQSKLYPKRFNVFSDSNLNKHFKFYKLNINKDFKKLEKLIFKLQPEIIIDFLGQGMVAESWMYPELTFNSNLISKIKLYEVLRKTKFLKKYIKISTPEVFGSTTVKEPNSIKYNPSTPYALSHSTVENYLRLLNKQFNFPVIISRFANFYGPYQRLYRVIPLAIHKAFSNEKFYLHGGGSSRRSFIYSEDFCEGIYKMITKGKIGAFYQFSSSEYLSIKKLVTKIYKKFGLNPDKFIVNVTDRPGKDKDYKIYDRDTKKKLNWNNKFELDKGIDNVIKWYMKHNKKFKKLDTKFIIKK
tara:strand:- start:886 stop:1875 length:990 start_codon:yes stop_codon:yes gene_type:complete